MGEVDGGGGEGGASGLYAAGSLVLVASPGERQSAEFLRKAAEMVRRLGMEARGDGDNAISLLLPNGSRIVGLPGNEGTVRGFSAVSMLLIDEASRVEDEMYHGAAAHAGGGGGRFVDDEHAVWETRVLR